MQQQVVFIQITDTHFGPQLLNKRFGWIKGYREHDVTLLTAFQAALNTVRPLTKLHVDDQFFILHNGDVTATGATEIRRCGIVFPWGTPISLHQAPGQTFLGLKRPATSLTMIPGNHDHWDGMRFRWGPYNQEIFGQYFPAMPWWWALASNDINHRPRNAAEKRVVVELFAVDSNSGIRDNNQVASILAKGHISDQEFDRLAEALEVSRQTKHDNALVVRAFVVHHPLAINQSNPLVKALFPASVKRLCELAAEFKIFAVLDGHTHRFYHHSYDLPGTSDKLHELRSATTFQGPASDETQGFIVHQIVIEDDQLVWKAWQFKFMGNAFQCAVIQPGNLPWWQHPV